MCLLRLLINQLSFTRLFLQTSLDQTCVFSSKFFCMTLRFRAFGHLGISVCRLSTSEYKQYFANDSDAQRHLPILCCMQLLVLVCTSHALLNEAFMMSASRSFSWGSNFTSCLLSFVDKSYCMLMCVCIVTSASRMFVQSLRYLFFQAVALPARRNKQSCAF